MLTLEDQLTVALQAMCPHVYPDIAPASTPAPYVVWHMYGGQSVAYVEGPQAPQRNAMVQINCWAQSRGAANTLSLQIAQALHDHALKAQAIAELHAAYDEDTGLYGALQDFSLWAER